MARVQPYNFVHTLLPQLAWRRPAAVRRELADPFLARELLLYMWDKAGEDLNPNERVPIKGLRLTWHAVAGRATALLHLPAPRALTEAYFAALVYEEEDDDNPPATDDDELRPRYFLLESTMGLLRATDPSPAPDAGQPTLLSERRGEHHRSFGPGPPGGRASSGLEFLQAVANILGPMPGAGLPLMRIVR